MDPNEMVNEILGESSKPTRAPAGTCQSCRRMFSAPKGRFYDELCLACEKERLECPNCGIEDVRSEFLCGVCLRSGVPHCIVCRRPPKPGSHMCAFDEEALRVANVTPSIGLVTTAGEFPTAQQMDAEMAASWERANPRQHGQHA